MAEQSPGYIFNAFIFTYGTQVLGASRDLLLTGLIVMTGLGFIWAPIAGALSDRVGRRQMYIIGCVFVAIFTFAYFAMLDTRIPWVIFTAERCHSSLHDDVRTGNRQVVVLERADWIAWLDLTKPEPELLRPLLAGSLTVEQVR